jgi:hypothetical protein
MRQGAFKAPARLTAAVGTIGAGPPATVMREVSENSRAAVCFATPAVWAPAAPLVVRSGTCTRVVTGDGGRIDRRAAAGLQRRRPCVSVEAEASRSRSLRIAGQPACFWPIPGRLLRLFRRGWRHRRDPRARQAADQGARAGGGQPPLFPPPRRSYLRSTPPSSTAITRSPARTRSSGGGTSTSRCGRGFCG